MVAIGRRRRIVEEDGVTKPLKEERARGSCSAVTIILELAFCFQGMTHGEAIGLGLGLGLGLIVDLFLRLA